MGQGISVHVGRSKKEQDVPVTLEQDDALSLISLEGAVEIGCAAELKRLLVQALDAGKETRVSLEAAADLDVTAVQLLWAAARQAKAAGVGFSLAAPAAGNLWAALGEAGLQQFLLPLDTR
jgi:anti-anti-sigma regulatory factor